MTDLQFKAMIKMMIQILETSDDIEETVDFLEDLIYEDPIVSSFLDMMMEDIQNQKGNSKKTTPTLFPHFVDEEKNIPSEDPKKSTTTRKPSRPKK